MSNTKKPSPLDDAIPFGITDYFRKSVLPLEISGCKKLITKETPRTQNEDEYFLLVTSGNGFIYVNQNRYRLKRGVMMCMGPFHNYCIIPEKGGAVEIAETHLNSGAYMYLLSCPYFKVTEFIVPSAPPIARLNEPETARVERIMRSVREADTTNYYIEKLNYLYISELFGILTTKASNVSLVRSKKILAEGLDVE